MKAFDLYKSIESFLKEEGAVYRDTLSGSMNNTMHRPEGKELLFEEENILVTIQLKRLGSGGKFIEVSAVENRPGNTKERVQVSAELAIEEEVADKSAREEALDTVRKMWALQDIFPDAREPVGSWG